MWCPPWHEAGHAVVAEVAGYPVERIIIRLEDVDGTDPPAGEVHVDIPADAPSYPVIVAAGWAAELAIGCPPEDAVRHGPPDLAILRGLGLSDAEMAAWRRRASLLLDQHLTAFSRLGYMLQLGGEFTGDQVRRCMAGGGLDAETAARAAEAGAPERWLAAVGA